jgi:hypothetical protein
MTVYVLRAGRLVAKTKSGSPDFMRSDHPAPRVSRLETYESPVTGKDVSSWRERDKDMKAADAVDPRDLPRKPFEDRKNKYGRAVDVSDVKFRWTDT